MASLHKELMSLMGLDRSWYRKARPIIAGLILTGSLFFFGYGIYRGWGVLKVHLKDLNFWFLGMALLSYPLGFIPTIWNWHKTMSYIGGFNRISQNARMYCLSCLPRRIPGFFWYIASRVALYQEYRINSSVILTATAMETIFLFLSGLSVYILSLGVSSLTPNPTLSGLAIAVFILTLAAPVWVPALYRRICKLLGDTDGSMLVEFSPYDVLVLLGILMLAWVGGGWILYLVANAVTAVSLAELPSLIGAWGAAGAVGLVAALLVQGMGLREVTLAMLLSHLMPLPVAATVSVLFRLLLMVSEFLWALLIIWLGGSLRQLS